MLSNKEIVVPNNLLNVAHKKKGVKAGIVNAGKPLPMLSVQDAVTENLIEPIFIGDEKEILKCAEDLKWDISKYEIIHEPSENNTAAIAAKLASEKKIRIGGMVKKDSVSINMNEINFIITDFKNEINVIYSGVVPNLFQEGKGVVAEGFLKDRNFFLASKILAKHDENYMPPEVKAALGEK